MNAVLAKEENNGSGRYAGQERCSIKTGQESCCTLYRREQDRRDAGQERCCTLYRREQDRRDAGQERDWTGKMLDWRDAVHCTGVSRTGERLDRSKTGQERDWSGEMMDRRDTERRDAGKKGCRKEGMPERRDEGKEG